MCPALRRFIFSAVIVLMSVAGLRIEPLFAQAADGASGEDGLAAYKAGRNADAERIWTPLAEAGDAVAQYSLGKLYETGANGTPDFEAAARWYALAAQQDMAAAQNNLGLMYAQGRGVPRDPARASQLWSRSANSSNPMAQYNLGLAYFRGDGVGQDQVEAAVWFHLAADAGVGAAQFALGQMHRLGLALPQDDRRALSWYERAAAKGHKDAQVQAARLKRLGVVAASSPDPVEEAARQTPEPKQTQTAENPAQGDRGTSFVTGGAAAAPKAGGADKSANNAAAGFQLESRLIRPEPGKAKPSTPAQARVAAVPPASEATQTPEKSAAAARDRRPEVSEKKGTFLWLLSAPDEKQALDLLREAKADYEAVLNGQELSLLSDPKNSQQPFYRLVVAASSVAEASQICVKIREINAEAFCATLVR